MSTFEVKFRTITELHPHPNADRLELVAIGGYNAVVQKGLHQIGDLILYIPEDSVFTDLAVAQALKIDTYLTGKQKNRVKAVRLRGIVSQGIVLPWRVVGDYLQGITGCPVETDTFSDGQDLTAELKIEKYEEPIPIQMQGVVRPWPSFVAKYDVENIKRPESLSSMTEGEPIVATEKLHGTNMTIAIGPGLEDDEHAFVCSRNMAIKFDPENVYWRATMEAGLIAKLERKRGLMGVETIALHGEVVGVQDLKYGCVNGQVAFYAFDLAINGHYVNWEEFAQFCHAYDIATVPVVYQGPYNYDALLKAASGPSMIASHIREGVVVKPLTERSNFQGRVQFKFVSDEYLFRSGDRTELH